MGVLKTLLKTQLKSSQLSLEGEQRRSAAAEKQAGFLAASLKTCQVDLSKATEASEYWRSEWQKLGTESRWDPKGRRIFVPQESDGEEPPLAEEVVPEQHPESTVQVSQLAAGDVAGVSGECPT
ncbi:hypothetical protein PIB30_030931 [Stylosanthes scabra]|uniref:Uncharacterized protein n=1 Tax=Stylosanthes scabra TaxID=79078 RepID=A0ABU6QBL7_9FABA|nr:hypothetical protein [Stylosanthes scabra]